MRVGEFSASGDGGPAAGLRGRNASTAKSLRPRRREWRSPSLDPVGNRVRAQAGVVVVDKAPALTPFVPPLPALTGQPARGTERA